MKKKSGAIEFLSALMLLVLGGIVLLYSISAKEVKQVQRVVRDSVDVACLAAAIVDVDQFIEDRSLVIDDYAKAYSRFEEILRYNGNMNIESVGEVNIHEFIIYNVIDDEIYQYKYSDRIVTEVVSKYKGDEKTPDGTLIESTMVYADIGFSIESFLGIREYVHVTANVDVVRNEG